MRAIESPFAFTLLQAHLAHVRIIGVMKAQANPDLLQRITLNPLQCGGRPCIRGMRIRVSDVLDLLASELNPEEIVKELPDLELDDVRAAIYYAARKFDHATLAA